MHIYLQALNSANFILIGTIAVVSLFLFVLMLLFINQRNNFRNQQKLEALEKKQQSLILHASFTAIENQKKELAANLHDDAGPLLASAKLFLPKNISTLPPEQQEETIKNAKERINETLTLVRNISHGLLPPTLEKFGLEFALKDDLEKLQTSGSFKTEFEFKDYKTRLTPERELNVFRVVQELLKNIFTHSNATVLNIKQDTKDNHFVLKIEHDGKGLEQEEFDKISKNSRGLGLRNIEGRIKLLKGSLKFVNNSATKLYETFIAIPYAEESIIETIQNYG